MAYECKIIADSLAPNGSRLTTFQVTYPRCVHSEIMTHRTFSRNSASSRAIPVEKMITKVLEDPFIPIYWGKNQKGMQAAEEMSEVEQISANKVWLEARDQAVKSVEKLIGKRAVSHPTETVYYDNRDIGLPDVTEPMLYYLDAHKQITNRLLEPFLWHTAIISATEYANFFAQRCHPDAQPEIRRIAEMMRDAYDAEKPHPMSPNGWHLPYVVIEERMGFSYEELQKASVARCARVSYLNQDGSPSVADDMKLYDRLVAGNHWSPFEHIAKPIPKILGGSARQSGNFRGWEQFRKQFPNENRTEYPHAG